MLFFSKMKKRMFSILWWWYVVLTALCAVEFDLLDAAAAPKSSTSKRNDNLKLIQSDKSKVYRNGQDKSHQTGDSDNDFIAKGGGDIIPIPDHLLNTDYEHHYSYEDETIEGYDDYEDQYHVNTGKLNVHFIFIFLAIDKAFLKLFDISYPKFNKCIASIQIV